MTRQNAHLFLPLVQALADGKTIQVQHHATEEWKDWGWGVGANADFKFDEENPPDCYRIKPEPVMVPLGPEDVPPGSVLRRSPSTWGIVSYVGSLGVFWYDREDVISWTELQDYEIKRPSESWQPCCKPAPES